MTTGDPQCCVGGLDQAVGQRDQPERREPHADRVEALQQPAATLLDEGQRPHEGDHGHGDVDEEHRTPPEVLQQPPAEQRSRRRPDPAHAGPDPDGTGALFPLERGGDDRQRGGHEECRAHAGECSCGDQGIGVVHQRAGQRTASEDGHTDQEDLPPAVAIAQCPTKEQQDGVGERVGVGDPLQLAGARMELLDQRGQGDVEHGLVEGDEQHREAHDDEGQPAMAGARGGGWGFDELDLGHGERGMESGQLARYAI